MLEQMRRGDIGHVERRVLAHQHHVHRRQIDDFRGPQRVVVAALTANLERLHPRDQPAMAEGKVLRQVMIQPVPALLAFQRKHEGAVGIDIDAGNRVHLNGDGEAHGELLGPERYMPVGLSGL